MASAGAETCSTCKPWWHLTSGLRPTDLAPESKGDLFLDVANLGTAAANGELEPVVIEDILPAGLKALSAEANAGESEDAGEAGTRGKVNCAVAGQLVTCTFGGTREVEGKTVAKTLPSYDLIEVRVKVQVLEGAQSGEANQLTVSGGGAAPEHLSRPIAISEEGVHFGLEGYELAYEGPSGGPVSQAASHPFQQTVTLSVNQDPATVVTTPSFPKLYEAHEPALVKDVHTNLPQGLVGDPSPLPRCTLKDFLTSPDIGLNGCPPDTAIGATIVSVDEPGIVGLNTFTAPVFNLEPAFGEPARFGFTLPAASVLIDTALRSEVGPHGEAPEYDISASATNITQVAALLSSQVTFWGVPGDPRHDEARGWGCELQAREIHTTFSCAPSTAQHPPAFLRLPTSCAGPLQSDTEVDSWAEPQNALDYQAFPALGTLDGCNQVPFAPAVSAQPSTDAASAPSGLDFNLDFANEGLTNAEGLAESDLKTAVVTLPEGFTINPSAGVGLAGCTPADYARETVSSLPGEGCPNESKLGTVEIETPLLTQKIHGNIFIAQPHENPSGSLVALYLVAKNPETGVLIKLAGKVTPNPVTGQLVTTFENNPQLPFDHFNFHFREGQQAPLITPPTCGTYETKAELTPWSEPLAPVTDTSTFTITSGVDGGPCPSGGVPPFHPGNQSGMLNNNAGTFSPFYLHLTRTDGEQEISGFSTSLPAGLTGNLTGIPFCPEADIEAARHKTGAQEEANPSCPAASEVGHSLVGTGVGAVLAYVPGKIYLAGPFHGAPFSLVSVTSAKVGPFDLGTVVLRFGLNIDPYTAQVSVSPTSSEPIPTIIQGIVTHVRDIRVYIDRQNFTLNPTSCNPMAIGSTLTSSLGAGATVTSPFQAASCASLKFAPKFAVSTSGKTSKANGASLHVVLTYPSAPQGTYADIAKVKVELPKQLPSRLTTLQKACTAAQFEANPAGCPSESAIGTAKAVVPNIPEPLAGPVYFVSHGGEAFPSLEIVLQGYGVKVILVGATFISKAGITSTTFKAIPDNPVSSFELTFPEKKYSALAANGNLCTQKLTMPTEFTGQNGAVVKQSTKVAVTGCAKAKPLTRAQKLKAALKACHKDRSKSKKTKCETTARKRYGPVKRSKSKSNAKGKKK